MYLPTLGGRVVGGWVVRRGAGGEEVAVVRLATLKRCTDPRCRPMMPMPAVARPPMMSSHGSGPIASRTSRILTHVGRAANQWRARCGDGWFGAAGDDVAVSLSGSHKVQPGGGGGQLGSGTQPGGGVQSGRWAGQFGGGLKR